MSRSLLFLIADTGGGHRAAATAVSHYLDRAHPGEFSVEIVDPFASASPRLLGRTAGLYGPLIQRAPWLWGGMFHATNSRTMVRTAELVMRSVDPAIARLMTTLEPAAVVSFHPLLNRAAVRARRRLGLRADRRVQVGPPADAGFSEGASDPGSRRARRLHLGIDPDRFTVLV